VTTNPMERSAAWTVLLERGLFKELSGNADLDMTTQFLADFHASRSTDMFEFAKTWSPTVTISQAEYQRLNAIAKAAQRVVMAATVRKTGPEWHAGYLADLNKLALLVPSTRRFDLEPLT
jgi:hypothetical protein